jgi:hypothetical protein
MIANSDMDEIKDLKLTKPNNSDNLFLLSATLNLKSIFRKLQIISYEIILLIFSWMKDGQPLTGLGGGGDLRLATVGRSDRGWYRCVASNMAGIRETDPVLLSVIGKNFINLPKRIHLIS